MRENLNAMVCSVFLLYTATPRFSHLNKNPRFDALQTSFLSLFRLEIAEILDTVYLIPAHVARDAAEKAQR